MNYLTFFRRIFLIPILILSLLTAALPCSAAEAVIGGKDSGLVNLLLIGQDRRKEEEPARSDSIILCTLHPDTGKVIITSFLRDLYVAIPGHEDNRLNASYALGGMALLKQTLEENFSLSIDGCIEVDFSRFAGIIDLLGGVTLELRQDEADAVNAAVEGTLCEGSHLLTGEQALAYTRIRNLDSDGDFSRTDRQRKLLSALLQRWQNASLLSILSAIADILPLISTDLSSREILLLAARLFPLLDDPEVVSQKVPAAGTYTCSTIRGMAVLTADMDAARKMLRQTLVVSPEDAAGQPDVFTGE